MHLVEVAAFRPQRCAVIPYIGAHHPNGFIDTGNELDGNRIYISIVGLAEMARVARIIPRAVPDLTAELEEAQARVAELELEAEEHARFREAAEYTLSQFGAKVRNKPGRKPEKAVA